VGADELRAKLAGEVLKARWSDLAPHHARGALVLADGAVDLLDVAVAIATDDSAAVGGWMGAGQLVKASEPMAAAWAEGSPWFQVVIVQPFVVAQVLAEAGPEPLQES
jgi:hypothetical protein